MNKNDLTQQLKTIIVSINQYIERIEECDNLGEPSSSKDRYSEIVRLQSKFTIKNYLRNANNHSVISVILAKSAMEPVFAFKRVEFWITDAILPII